MIKRLFILTIVLILSLPVMAFGANHYIRAHGGNSGDGTTWAAAGTPGGAGCWTDVPASYVRGDTYYFADGTYSDDVLNTAVSGTDIITLKKASVADHGTETGWDNGYGDGTATFSGNFLILTSYWTINGAYRTDWETGYGFKVDADGTGDCIDMGSGSTVSNIIVQYTDLDGNTTADNCVYHNSPGASNFTFSYCYIHDPARCQFLWRNVDNVTVEYCKMARNHHNVPAHSQGVSAAYGLTGHVYRHNIWEDIAGTHTIGMYGDGMEVYGSLFINVGNSPIAPSGDYTTNGAIGTWTETDPELLGGTLINCKVYNNTFVDLKSTTNTLLGENADSSGNVAYNNIAYNCQGYGVGGWTNQYNTFPVSSSAQFVSYATDDFRLASATDAGTVLGSPYNVDMYGQTRGVDAVFDRGYAEFTGAAAPTGTVVIEGGISETQVVDGGKTLIITLTGTTWDTDIGSESAETTALIAGIDSNKAEANGWDAVVKAGLTHANVSRDSDTVVTITLPAFAAYQITASETITITIDSTCVASATQIVATPTFIVSVDTENEGGGEGEQSADGRTMILNANGFNVTVGQ